MGCRRQVPMMRVDWWQIVVDLSRKGMAQQEVGRAINKPSSTVHGWKMGAEPKHADGEILIALWCEKTGNTRELVPMTSRFTWLP